MTSTMHMLKDSWGCFKTNSETLQGTLHSNPTTLNPNPTTRYASKVSFPQIWGGNVIECVPRKASKLIAFG